MLTGCWQQPVNITRDCTNCCLYRVDPPDDKQQACSKHVEAYYWNKLIENSASCWFRLYRYITMHGQQNIKNNSCVWTDDIIILVKLRDTELVIRNTCMKPFWRWMFVSKRTMTSWQSQVSFLQGCCAKTTPTPWQKHYISQYITAKFSFSF